ncbi:MAG: hypothetical protein RIK87_07690 [Fuerstiella sp.]
MSNQKREIKEAMIASLAELSDSTFESAGFKRRANSLRYDRKLESCTQSVEVCLEHTPRDNPNAAAAVYPWLTVSIPEVDAIAREMTGRDESLLSSAASTLHQPIELVSPKGKGARWYIYQPDSVVTAVNEFRDFSKEWVFPFLDEYSTAGGVVALHRASDERVLHDQDQFLRVVAAMIHSGAIDSANETLESKFGRPAMRRRFAPVFEFVANSSSADG